jgi:UDP-glucose 4-epimerase
MIHNKRVLVTGGTGSLGKVLTRNLISGKFGSPRRVAVFSRDESKHYFMKQEFSRNTTVSDALLYANKTADVEFIIGDVRSYESVVAALQNIDVVIHAAALKQVPTCEYFPYQAVMTNCMGAQNIVRAITELSLPVETVIGISTDKACKPVNMMGMSKAMMEKIFLAANLNCPNTNFSCVRYGNVLASRGSVIPLFLKQIAAGGELTVTDGNMTRFLMTLQQACELIFHAISDRKRAGIYVPVVPAGKVGDIADLFSSLTDSSVKVIGERPGEKKHEILISEEELSRVEQSGSYFRIGSALPELQVETDSQESQSSSCLQDELSSKDYVVSIDELERILRENSLLPGMQGMEQEELLR